MSREPKLRRFVCPGCGKASEHVGTASSHACPKRKGELTHFRLAYGTTMVVNPSRNRFRVEDIGKPTGEVAVVTSLDPVTLEPADVASEA